MSVDLLEFDEASHTYTVKGRRIPSVTDIIRPLHDFSHINPAVLERKRQLGTDVHFACELDDDRDLDDAATDAEVMGYVDGWRKFKRDTGAVVLMNEKKLFHPSLFFAGTLDRLVTVRAGDLYLIDLKTSVAMTDAFGVQLCGYELLLQGNAVEGRQNLARKGLQLRPNGDYRLIPYNDPNDAACFRGLLSATHWKQNHECTI